MNSKHELSPEAPEQCPSIKTQNNGNDLPAAVTQEHLQAEASEPPPANHPSLLDSFYHWVMSRW